MTFCAVSYLNTKPFLYGIENNIPNAQISLQVPADCVSTFIKQKADFTLLPVGALVDFQTIQIIDHYCIGANQHVDSVFLFAHQPLNSVQTIFLDPHSRSSNGLTKILTQFHWNISVKFILPEQPITNLPPNTATVCIGDKAIRQKKDFQFVYDLAYEWRRWTGLPFTFAIWAINPETPYKDLQPILNAFDFGIENLHQVAEIWSEAFHIPAEQILHYFQNNISYDLDEDKKKSLSLYLQHLAMIDGKNIPEIRFLR